MAYCSVMGCNTSQKKSKGIHFYRFPKDPVLSEQWSAFCRIPPVNTKNGNSISILHLTVEYSHRFVFFVARICSLHFEDKFNYKSMQQIILGYSPKNRRRLVSTAIPTIKIPLSPNKSGFCGSSDQVEVSVEHNFTPNKNGSTEKIVRKVDINARKKCHVNLFGVTDVAKETEHGIQPLNDFEDTTKQRNYENYWEKKFNELQKKYDDIQRENEKIEEENRRLVKKLNEKNDLVTIGTASKKLFTPGQIRRLIKQKRVCWSSDDIASAISLRSVSPKAYRYLRQTCKFPFPDLRTLRRWAHTFDISPGLLKNVALLMEKQAKNLTVLERLTVLSFDEMFVNKQICFLKTKEQVFGPHKAVQVIMARGLCSNWKQPIFYNFDTPVTKELLHNSLKQLYHSGYTVTAIVSDMGTTNMRLWKCLNINTSNTSFSHPSDETKLIYVFADVPHLLKLIRNHFLDHGFIFENSTLTKSAVEQFLALGETSDLKMGHKITQHLIDVKRSQRQKVKWAAKLFSRTTANVIKYCGENNLINDPNFNLLANFVELVNDWFDLFNTNSKYSRTGVVGYGLDLQKQQQLLSKMTETITKLRVKGHKCLLPFQKGIIVSNSSLEKLFLHLKEQYNLEYILTHRLNQDVLENFFSHMRAMGAANDQPNPVDFMHRLRWYILGRHSPRALSNNKNCEEDNACNLVQPLGGNEVCLTVPLFTSLIGTSNEWSGNQDFDDFAHLQFTDNDSDIHVSLPSTIVSDEGLRYLAGYVAHRFRTKYSHLGVSSQNVVASTSTSDWIQFISKGQLIQPSPEFLQIAKAMETLFLAYHGPEIKKEPKIIQNIVNLVKMNIDCMSVPDEVLTCLVRTRTYIRIREMNKVHYQDSLKHKGLRKMKKIPDLNI